MIYAVNRRTKAHRVAAIECGPMSSEEALVHADPGGWIPWEGGECPLTEGGDFNAKRRDGAIIGKSTVNFWGRGERDRNSDIIAYRPILDADTKPEPPAWGGEEWEGYYQYGATIRWRKVEVLKKVGGAYAVYVPEIQALGWCKKIRPIRSEEDRAVEEMYEAATGDPLEGTEMDDSDAVSVCRELYRAGYRKTGGE